jgi:GWxTD domain-containing protein
MNQLGTVTWSLFLAFVSTLPLFGAGQGSKKQEMEEHYKKWLKKDVVYIITDEERAVFQKLATDEEREQFIDQFWLRRDPDPRTAVNEFREEHYRRIAYANEKFTSGDPGWMTDRGRIYILHGEPDSKESRPDGGAYARPIEEGGGTTTVYPYEKWRYRYIEGLGNDIEIEFIDPTHTGKYELAVFPWEKDALLHIGMGPTLAEQTHLSTRADHPALTPAAGGAGYGPENWYRRAKDTPFARYELVAKVGAAPVLKHKALKELVEVSVNYEVLPLTLRQDYFRLNETQVLVPITVQIQNRDLTFKVEAGSHVARMAVYGSITSLGGKIVTEFEHDIVASFRPEHLSDGMQKASMYQKVIPLDRNLRYKLDLVVKDLNSGHVGIVRQAIIPPAFNNQAMSASSVVLSDTIQPLKALPNADEMFVLGDVKVLPRIDRRFTPDMPLGVYFQVYNAALDQTSLAPSLYVYYKLVKEGRVLKMAADENGESTQFASGQRIVLVRNLSLAGLEPGNYQIQVEVVDRLSDRRVHAGSTFTLAAPDRAALK